MIRLIDRVRDVAGATPEGNASPRILPMAALEHAQEMAGHESLRTTKLYDRTKERFIQDGVERIRL